jgi:hypothetical protein
MEVNPQVIPVFFLAFSARVLMLEVSLHCRLAGSAG